MRRIPVILLQGLLAAGAFAQTATKPADPPVNPLAGPSVREGADTPAPSLVQRDFNGKVVLPECSPEEAALAILDLKDADLTEVQEVLDRRAGFLDEFVGDNIPLLTKFGAGGSDKLQQLAMVREAYVKLEPMLRKGTLQRQLRDALPEARRTEFDKVLKEFWDAVVEERKVIPKADGKLPNRFEIVAGTRLELLGKEIERAFLRLVVSGDLYYRVLFKDMSLRDSQAGKIRTMIEDQVKRGDKVTDQDNLRLFLAILAILDRDQQKELIANIRELRDGQAKKKAAEKPEKAAEKAPAKPTHKPANKQEPTKKRASSKGG